MPGLVKAALLMFVYAIGLLVIGWLTMVVAPPGAKAITAIIAPGAMAVLMIVCAVATLMIGSNRAVGMAGIHVGLVLPLLFAIVVGTTRLPKSLDAAFEFKRAIDSSASGVIVTKSAQEGEPHPKGYQAVGMGGMVALSGFAFVALLMQRPKVPKREPHAAPVAPPPSEPRHPVDDGE